MPLNRGWAGICTGGGRRFFKLWPRRGAMIAEAPCSMLGAMRPLRFAAAAVVAAILPMTSVVVGCYTNPIPAAWVCRDPATGNLVVGDYDLSHYVNGVFDPCHCMDPGGPLPTCDIPPDAGADVADAGAEVTDAGAD